MPPSQHPIASAVQPNGHSVGKPRPSLEFSFRNGDDERGFRHGSNPDCITKSAAGYLQRAETIDNDCVDTASDQSLDPGSHTIHPMPVDMTIFLLDGLAADINHPPIVQDQDPAVGSIKRAVAELNQSAYPSAGTS